jgi:mannitol/fructose-specific phosphotransferase system IIA component (Ntr-type)
VKTIFVLVGTPDERNFHLHALMSIAQMSELPDFPEQWRRAQSKNDLRDILLLSDRTRHD